MLREYREIDKQHPTYIIDTKKSDEENIVAEEFLMLTYYIEKLRKIFRLFEKTLSHITGVPHVKMPKTITEWDNFFSEHKIDRAAKDAISGIIKTPKYMWLYKISTIAYNTEYHFLGRIDTGNIAKYLSGFYPLFERYVDIVDGHGSV